MAKKIVITGGAGFIGHNIALELKKHNYEVFIVDSLQVNNIANLTLNFENLPFPKLSEKILKNRISLLENEDIPLIIQDLRDYGNTSRILEKINPDIIIHLAAVSHANRSNKDPHNTFDHSLRTLENVLDYSKKRVSHFIYFSSSMVYGNFNDTEVNEDTNCLPLGIYGALKLSGELLLKSYNQVFDLPFTIIRPSALYGQRCISRRVGQIFIENAINKRPITIHGSGDEKLDFTYIKDLVNGIKLVIENKNSLNNTFNLTYGSGRKIKDLIEILKNSFPNLSVNYEKKSKLVPERGTLSIEKAKNLLNYNPSFPIEIGFKEYISWYLDFQNKH